MGFFRPRGTPRFPNPVTPHARTVGAGPPGEPVRSLSPGAANRPSARTVREVPEPGPVRKRAKPKVRWRRRRRVRTPTILQMESTECGAASLGIVLAYFGRHVPLPELRVDCRVSRDGSNALYVKKTGEKYGLVGKGYQMTVDELRSLEPPFIVFWNMNHFLVVEGFGRDRVYLNDPAAGRRAVTEKTFRASYTGIAFHFTPGPNFRKGGARPNTWKGISRRIGGARAGIVFVVLAGLALMVADLVGATFPLIFVDQLLIQGRHHWIRPLLLVMAAAVVFRFLLVKIQHSALLRLKLGLATGHSAKFLWHVLRLPVAFYQQRYAGDISGRVDSNSLVADLVSGELATTIIGLVMVVFYAAMMFAFDPLLATVGVAIGTLNIIGIVVTGRLLADENLKMRQDRSKLFACMTRTLQIIETIKAGASESEALVHLTGHQARLSNTAQTINAAGSLLVVLPPFLSVLTTAAVLGIGGTRVVEGVMSVGALVAFQTLMANFHRPFAELVRLGTTLQTLQAELARLDDVHQYEIEPTLAPAAVAPARLPRQRLSGRLELRNVTFGFNRTLAEPLIRDFSLELRPGSRVALVGDSGSGKSTIGRLVAGLYRPWDGEILYDGRRLEEIPRQVFTDQVALVDDQTFLFSGTIRENLTLWDETVPERDVVRAAMDAEIHRDLVSRRGGYHGRLAEGARNLSGGQRQRIEIARALVRDPALLILDEATSALDPVTEALVDDHLRRRGCTCLIIAHRLSTIRDCDEIIVLRQGRVIQRGTHDQLMADLGGFYRELQLLQERSGTAIGGATRPALPAPHRNGSTSHAPAAAVVVEETPPTALALDLAEMPRGAALMDALEPDGVTVVTAGNCPLVLDDPGAVWRVIHGKVDVFHVPSEAGQTPGRRRHLCRVEEGGAIFAMDGVPSDLHGELLAVGVGLARLRKFAKADLMRLSFDPALRRGVAEMIDDWVDRISRATVPGDPPVVASRLEAGDARDLAPDERVVARNQVLWVRQNGPPVRFCGAVRVPDCPYESRFPLSLHAWLSLEGAGVIHAVDTETLMEDGDPWVGLRRFHAVVLQAMGLVRDREGTQAEDRLQRAARRDAALFAGTLADLSGLAARRPVPQHTGADGEHLLAACRLVAAAHGVQIKPASLEGAEDPLRQIARASGFRTRRIRLAVDWWTSDGGPLLGFLEDGNVPVALLRSPHNLYTLVDPSRGVSVAVTPEVARRLAPTAVMFYRTLGGAGRLSARDVIKFCVPVIRNESRTLVATGFAGALLALVIPWVVGIAIDEAIPRADRHQLGLLCAFLVAVGLAVAAFQMIQGAALVRIKGRLEATLLPAAWDRLLNLPVQFFMKQAAGDLALRAMSLARIIGMLASTWVASLMMSLFALLNIVVLFVYSAKLAVVAVALMAVVPLATALILRALWRSQRLVLRAQGDISGLLLLLLGGVARIRVAGAERRAFARWAEKYRRQLDLTIRCQKHTDRLLLLSALWPLVVVMVVFGLTIEFAPAGLSAGAFLAFNLALSQTLSAVIGVGTGMLTLLYGLEEYERFRPLLKVKPEALSYRGEAVALKGALRVANVSFRYDPNGPLILDSVDLQVRPGEFVAIVGPSGSGKSTLLRLLLGFEAPADGAITYDGRDLPTLDIQDVRRQFGVVLQDAQLRPGDIYTNIVGNAPDRAREDAWEAARLAGLADDIEQMPMGIHTVVSEGGGGLSSGQRQRLMIARALAGRPKILLFDEATSVLDNRSQAVVFENIRKHLPGTTLLTIAHRLSTVVDADRIYVFGKGRVVQSGRYSQLIREPGPFQDLARRQTLA